jgi:hypothetical protein
MSEDDKGVVLTPEQIRRRRARNIAIGLALAALVLLFYLMTLFKLGGSVAERAI